MFSFLQIAIVTVLFGCICNESRPVGDLPAIVQGASELLTNEDLEQIGDFVASSPDTLIQIVSYWTTNWEQSQCDWLNDELPGSTTNEWKYESSTDVITGPLVTWCDIEETFNPFDLSNVDKETVPTDLYNEISYLLSAEADGNQCLARLKFYVWDIFGIEWNDEFVASLGFESDMALFMTIGEQLSSLSDDNDDNGECSLLEPADLMEPLFEPITQIFDGIFESLHETSITATASVGVKMCWNCDSELCFGGGFGIAVNGQGEGFLYRESVLNATQNSDDISANGMNYQSTYQPIETTHSTQTNNNPQSTDNMHSIEPSSTQHHHQNNPFYPNKSYNYPHTTQNLGLFHSYPTMKHQKRRMQSQKKKHGKGGKKGSKSGSSDVCGEDYKGMSATFYFEFGLFEAINDIHSVELEREIIEELAGNWWTDPAVVYNEDDNAIGLTFAFDLSFDDSYTIQFASGTPIGAIVLDKVAELLTEDDGENENKIMMNQESILSRERVFDVNEYVPMMIVCAAVGALVIVGSKVYSSYLGRKEYASLLG